MHQEELMQSNIENLIAFWAACGMKDSPLPGGRTLYHSVHWPRRMWFDYDHHPDRQDLEQALVKAEMVGEPMMIPQWHEADEVMGEVPGRAGFEVKMTQEAMVASLGAMEAQPVRAVDLRWVTNAESAGQWTRVASESFGYPIHEPVIAGLMGVPGFHLLLADVDDTVVGTGLLLQTGQTAGIHMMGVPPVHRRKGYARQIMFGLLALARELGCEHATLQASAAGKALYQQLGFKAQGSIRSYRRISTGRHHGT